MGPPQNFSRRKSGRKIPSTTPPRIYEPHTSYLIDYPSLEIGPENSINYPPSNSRTSSTTPPPRNRAKKLVNYPPPPPRIHEPHRLPPLEIGPKNSSTTPPRIHEPHRLPPPPLEIDLDPPTFEAWRRPCP